MTHKELTYLLWLYNTLNDFISGLGATDEQDKKMEEIKQYLNSKR